MMFTDMQDMQTSKFPTKKTMMGKSGVGRGIAGIIGDVLLQSSGFAPIYSPALAQRRESEAQRAALEERRAYDEQQWMRRKEYERDNPAPTSLQRDIAAAGLPHDRAKQALEQYVNNVSNPVQSVRVMNPDGSEEVRYVRTQSGGGVPTSPVGKLTPIGGPTPRASGGF